MSSGLLDLSPAGVALYTLVVTQATIASVTIFLHRHQAHRALELHPAVSHLFRFWLWLTTGMVTREWVAVHRKHHAKCETADDPHSPRVFGLGTVLLKGAELYRAEADKAETLASYGRGAPDDWLERHVYSRHRHFGITLMLLLDLVLLGPIGLSVWGMQMLWIPFWAAGVINGAGHAIGYRTFATPNASTNIVPWGLLIGGEELHNNHHASPGSAKFSVRRWEIDLGWLYIMALAKLGLARVTRMAPPPVRITGLVMDPGRLQGSAYVRFQLLAAYGRRVLARVYRSELKRETDKRVLAMLESVAPLLRREEALMDASGRDKLCEALAQIPSLRIAYQYRDSLLAIWHDYSVAGTERLRQALQDWCRQAETSGVEALRDFSLHLSGKRRQSTA